MAVQRPAGHPQQCRIPARLDGHLHYLGRRRRRRYASGEHCATNASDVSCRVATLVISPSTKAGTRSGALFNHYSLLATTEQLLHLSKLGLAASATTMTKAFNL